MIFTTVVTPDKNMPCKSLKKLEIKLVKELKALIKVFFIDSPKFAAVCPGFLKPSLKKSPTDLKKSDTFVAAPLKASCKLFGNS